MNTASIGAKLKQIRLERGISLEEIQKKTKIHLNVLRAIEGDSLSDLSPVYMNSFIKIYCAYLGLDPKEYIGLSKGEQKPVLNAKVGRDLGYRPEKRKSFIQDFSFKVFSLKAMPAVKRAAVFVLLATVFILALAGSLRFLSAKKAGGLNPPGEKRQIQVVKDEAAVVSKKGAASGIIVGILAKEKCWVVVKVDGRTAFQGMLPKGRFESWKAKDKAELTLGDAGAVELQVNDRRFSNLGRRGQSLKNILINKEGLKIAR